MKKIVKGIISLLCVGVIAVGAASCGKEVISAYDIAVKNGFVGTEEEWLRSLHGKNGEDAPQITITDLYEQAKKDNPDLTYLEFCKQLGITAQEGNDLAQIANNMMSVVEIYCGWTKTTVSSGGLYPVEEKKYEMSTGSGVIIDLNKEAGNALILTNYHVVYNKDSDAAGICDTMKLYLHGAAFNLYADETKGFNDGGADAMDATFVGGSMDYDVAVLEIKGSEYLKNSCATKAEFGDSESVKEGEKVFAIGNPDGAGISVTSGVLSVKSEYIYLGAIDKRDENNDDTVDAVSYRVMRTDAAINGGNSGGGLFNATGKLIGITNAKSVGTDKDDMGYALPILDVKAVYENIMDNRVDGGVGCVKRALLGVMIGVDTSYAEKLDDGTLNIKQTFSIAEAVTRGACAYGKLFKDDIIVWGQHVSLKNGIGNKVNFDRRYQLNALLLNVRLGDSLVLGVMRNGKEERVTLVFNSPDFFVDYR